MSAVNVCSWCVCLKGISCCVAVRSDTRWTLVIALDMMVLDVLYISTASNTVSHFAATVQWLRWFDVSCSNRVVKKNSDDRRFVFRCRRQCLCQIRSVNIWLLIIHRVWENSLQFSLNKFIDILIKWILRMTHAKNSKTYLHLPKTCREYCRLLFRTQCTFVYCCHFIINKTFYFIWCCHCNS